MKAFNVLLVTQKPESIESVSALLKGIGSTIEEDSGEMSVFLATVVPSDQDETSATLRDRMRQVVDVFKDRMMVVEVNLDHVSYLNWNTGNSIAGNKPDPNTEKRNFSRFGTMDDAYAAYLRENPKWVYTGGGVVAQKLPFEEWCWLPVKSDGLYELRLYAPKYIAFRRDRHMA